MRPTDRTRRPRLSLLQKVFMDFSRGGIAVKRRESLRCFPSIIFFYTENRVVGWVYVDALQIYYTVRKNTKVDRENRAAKREGLGMHIYDYTEGDGEQNKN